MPAVPTTGNPLPARVCGVLFLLDAYLPTFTTPGRSGGDFRLLEAVSSKDIGATA